MKIEVLITKLELSGRIYAYYLVDSRAHFPLSQVMYTVTRPEHEEETTRREY